MAFQLEAVVWRWFAVISFTDSTVCLVENVHQAYLGEQPGLEGLEGRGC